MKSLLPGRGGVLLPPPPPPPQLARASRASASPTVLHRLDTTVDDRIDSPLYCIFIAACEQRLQAAWYCSSAGRICHRRKGKSKKGRTRAFGISRRRALLERSSRG